MTGSTLTALSANPTINYHPIFVPLRFAIFFYSKIINYPTQLTQGVSARGAKCPEAVSHHVLK